MRKHCVHSISYKIHEIIVKKGHTVTAMVFEKLMERDTFLTGYLAPFW